MYLKIDTDEYLKIDTHIYLKIDTHISTKIDTHISKNRYTHISKNRYTGVWCLYVNQLSTVLYNGTSNCGKNDKILNTTFTHKQFQHFMPYIHTFDLQN